MHAVRLENEPRSQSYPEAKLTTFDHGIMLQMCQKCVNTADKLIKTIFENLATTYRSAVWRAVYCKAN